MNYRTDIIFHGDQYFDSLVRDFQSAKEDIWLESYIFNLDAVGLRILSELEKAHRRGVHVRILIDGIGSFNWITAIQKECEQRKLNLRIYHPLPFRLLQKRLSWKNLRRALMMFRRINKRNHRKLVLIDRKILYAGSMNISQVHSELYQGDQYWRDTAVRLEFSSSLDALEPVISTLHLAWRSSKMIRWDHWNSFFKKNISMNTFRVNHRLTQRWSLLRDLLSRLKKSQNRILITNAYFIPHRSVLRALIQAAKRGVYVGLCVPEKSDVWIVREASRSLYYRLLKAGVHIFEFQHRMLHAKTLMIDHWAMVGSHNLNHRSFFHDLEIDIAITSPHLIDELEKKWQADIQQSKEITEHSLGQRTLWQRIISRMLYWFRYWI